MRQLKTDLHYIVGYLKHYDFIMALRWIRVYISIRRKPHRIATLIQSIKDCALQAETHEKAIMFSDIADEFEKHYYNYCLSKWATVTT